MTYVAYGPLGPRLALAVSSDLERWQRLGPVQFTYQPGLGTDLCMFPNKDAVFFPEPVPGPDGRPSYAMLHRPMWDLGWIREGEIAHLPAGITDERPGIWISYVPVELVEADIRALARPQDHTCVALPMYPYEALKIGAGPPPVRIDEGWLLIHHGVTGEVPDPWDPTTQKVEYSAGAMVLDSADPSRVLARTDRPILAPETGGRAGGNRAQRRVPDGDRGGRRRPLRVLRHGRRPHRRRAARPDAMTASDQLRASRLARRQRRPARRPRGGSWRVHPRPAVSRLASYRHRSFTERAHLDA